MTRMPFPLDQSGIASGGFCGHDFGEETGLSSVFLGWVGGVLESHKWRSARHGGHLGTLELRETFLSLVRFQLVNDSPPRR